MKIWPRKSRRLLVPEVIQTSAMDCGPASLKCLLEGFGISVSYGRLREACQTDVDGTSIDTMEEVAVQLGLDAEQIMLPPDHLLFPEAQALPAIIVTRLPNGITHFVVAWRRHGRIIQVMNPAMGRCWIAQHRFLDELYIHATLVSASAWREWAGSEEFLRVLRRRLQSLGHTAHRGMGRLLDGALADPSWKSLATLDAATRMVHAIVRCGGLARGRQAARVLEAFFERARGREREPSPVIPPAYWFVQPALSGSGEGEQLVLRGAVLVCVRGLRAAAQPAATADESAGSRAAPLSPELVAALEESPSRPGRELIRFLRADGFLTPMILVGTLALAAGGVVIEALLFRWLFDPSHTLGVAYQRMGAMGALLAFVMALLFLDFPIVNMLLRIGRHLEVHLRLAFLEKIPRLVDRYFQSRLTSDMAERSHSVHRLRLLPDLAAQLLRSSFEIVLTTAGIIWLDPKSAPVAVLATLLAIGLPLLAQPLLTERDLRVRSHGGALSRFYLDALLGLVAVRTHGAERAVRSEHQSLLVDWVSASIGLQRAVVLVEGVQSMVGFGLAAWLLIAYLGRAGETGSVLLLVYWALNLPVLGQEVSLAARQYPIHRNVTLRLLEPLGAPEEPRTAETEPEDTLTFPNILQTSSRGVDITLEDVSVRAAGHTILEGIDLRFEPGSHVAIVGPSGAGKSSLVGLLLGWHKPASGRVRIDGRPLDGQRIEQLRRETAWVDPAVQLWNRSFLENLRYGTSSDAALRLSRIIESAELHSLLEKLPDGLQTSLGEGGAFISGGEGQRVRLGRAMLRSPVKLVILDEPFRGLDRGQRRELLARARAWWQGATLLCITHDLSETQAFERVLVIDGGRIVEDGVPAELSKRPDSRYRRLLEAEMAVREGLWSSGSWRRWRLEEGRLSEDPRPKEA